MTKRYKIGVEASSVHEIEADSYEEAERKAEEASPIAGHNISRTIPMGEEEIEE